MQIPILIEPLDSGSFRARAGEPFAASAEGPTADEAVLQLQTIVRERLKAGSRLGVIELANGAASPCTAELHLGPLPDEDWFFQTMREALAENRRQEDERDE